MAFASNIMPRAIDHAAAAQSAAPRIQRSQAFSWIARSRRPRQRRGHLRPHRSAQDHLSLRGTTSSADVQHDRPPRQTRFPASFSGPGPTALCLRPLQLPGAGIPARAPAQPSAPVNVVQAPTPGPTPAGAPTPLIGEAVWPSPAVAARPAARPPTTPPTKPPVIPLRRPRITGLTGGPRRAASGTEGRIPGRRSLPTPSPMPIPTPA